MIKVAIFVEGQTELIFVREYLLKSFEYSNLAIECYTLFAEGRFHPTEYAFPNENAAHFFQIINVGNDNALLTRILSREKYLWNSGFDFIIGLRDMYSKNYRELSNQGKMEKELNQQFIATAQETLAQRALKPEKIRFCYAIMETEAWILGLPHCFEYIHSNLTAAYILENLHINLEDIDPVFPSCKNHRRNICTCSAKLQ